MGAMARISTAPKVLADTTRNLHGATNLRGRSGMSGTSGWRWALELVGGRVDGGGPTLHYENTLRAGTLRWAGEGPGWRSRTCSGPRSPAAAGTSPGPGGSGSRTQVRPGSDRPP